MSRIIRKILNYQNFSKPSGSRHFLLKDIAIVELRLILAATDSCGCQQRHLMHIYKKTCLLQQQLQQTGFVIYI